MKALNWKTAVGLAVVLAVAGALRLYEIGSKSLWLDEVYSEVRTRGGFRESMDEIVRYDAPPPSYLLALWFWRSGFGDSDAALRIFSACCDLVTVALIFFLLRHLTGRAGAFAGAILYATSSFAVYFAQEARQYALFNMLATASTFVFVKIFLTEERPSPVRWLLYALLIAVMLYTFQYGLFVLAAHLICLILLRIFQPETTRSKFAPALAMMVLGLVIFSPYVPRIVSKAQELSAAGVAGRDFDLLNIPLTTTSQMCGPEGLLPFERASVWFRAVAALLTASAVGGILAAPDRKKRGILFGSLLIVPFVCLTALPYRPHIFEPKHLIFLCPMLFGGAAAFFAEIRDGKGRPIRVLAGIVVFCGLLAINCIMLVRYYSTETEKEAWSEATANVCDNLKRGDAVLFMPFQARFPFERYLPEGTKVYSRRYGIPTGRDAIGIPVLDMLKGFADGKPVYYSEREVKNRLAGVSRLWVVSLASNVSRELPSVRQRLQRILESDFAEAETHGDAERKWRGLAGTIEVRLYERR